MAINFAFSIISKYIYIYFLLINQLHEVQAVSATENKMILRFEQPQRWTTAFFFNFPTSIFRYKPFSYNNKLVKHRKSHETDY